MATPPTTLERLRIFHAVVTAGTLAGAARTLGYTASAVSQHISALEREARVPLVERSNRGVKVTAAGAYLARQAAEVLDHLDVAFATVRSPARGSTTVLTVAAFPTAITAMLLPAREALAPAVRLAVVDAEPAEALAALRARRVDAAVTDYYVPDPWGRGDSDDLVEVKLRLEPVCLVHREDRRPPRALAAYSDSSWVLGGEGSRLGTIVRGACRQVGFDPRVIVESDDHHVTFETVLATGAVAFLPELALGEVPRGIRITRRLDVRLERGIELVTRRSSATNPAIGALTALLGAPTGGR